MRVLPSLLLSAVLAAPALAHGPEDDSDDRSSAARKIGGMQDYRLYCAACHGESGAGDGVEAGAFGGAVPDFTTPQAVVRFTREGMLEALDSAHDERTRARWTGDIGAEAAEGIVSYMREAFMLPAPVEDASAGRSIYARSCSVCHGDRGNGASWARNSLNPPPFDFRSDKARTLSRRHMINTVTYGRPETAMVGYSTQLSRTEIAAVVDYIRSTFVFAGAESLPDSGNGGAIPGNGSHGGGHESHHAGSTDKHAPLPAGLVGDAETGKRLFDANCSACHGKEGDGDGPRAYFINPPPANFLTPESRESLNRPHLFEAISEGVIGTEMPAWSKVLSDQAIADLAEYVFVSFIAPDDEGADATREPHLKKK